MATQLSPAVWVELNALNNQPEPMIDPRDTNISPQKPTVRCSPALTSEISSS